jgi:transglutaminase-like putative cysteine protease
LLLGFAWAEVAKTPSSPRVAIADIAKGIEKYIAERAALDGGAFRLPHGDRELRLKLVRVHLEFLSDLGGGVTFACVDLVDLAGDVYDVDFFMKGTPGAFRVTETTVHKVNGQPLYAWEEGTGGLWHRVAITNASPRLLGVLTGRDEFDFTYRVRLPSFAGSARLWMPLARSDAWQTVQLREIRAPGPWKSLSDKRLGNTVAFLELGAEVSGATIEIHYHVSRVEKASSPVEAADPAALGPERMVPANPSLSQAARKAAKGRATDLQRARALYDHVIDHMKYAKAGTGWGLGDASRACTSPNGNCTDFHSYFIALCRAVGIPARFAIGAAIPSERNEGGTDGYHCWAEFEADGKWWPVDISEADKNSGLASYYFGRQPANRFELSRGRDLVVEPGPVSGPINFLAYAVLEVDGKPVTAPTDFSFQRASVSIDAKRSNP